MSLTRTRVATEGGLDLLSLALLETRFPLVTATEMSKLTQQLAIVNLIRRRRHRRALLLAAVIALIPPERPLVPDSHVDLNSMDSATSVSMFRFDKEHLLQLINYPSFPAIIFTENRLRATALACF